MKADPLPAAPAPDDRLLTFTVGSERMGLVASLVREIVPLPPLARVPHAPDALMGVANVRGAIVPVLSVARLLGRTNGDERRVIVTDLDGTVGLAVSSVSRMASGEDGNALARIDMAALVARAVPKRGTRRSIGTGAAAASAQAGQARSETVPMVAFRAGGQDFALPLSAVEEVLRLPPGIARMPQADAVVLGSIALRGAVLPLLSLAALLALAVTAPTRRTRVVVVRIGTHRVGIVVDAMQTIERVPEDAIDAVPHVLNRGGGEARIQSICRLDEGTRLLSVLAPDQLLNEDITARLLQVETRNMIETGDKGQMGGGSSDERGERFVLFRIGGETFGLPIDAVQEVASLPSRLTPLPRAPAFVQGVMSVRGQIIPVIDQGRRFHGVPVSGSKPRVIVVQVDDLTAGFVVDAVSQVAWIGADALGETPDLGSGETQVFDRVARVEGEETLVLIVSPRQLLDKAERDLLAELGRKAAKDSA